MIWIESAAEKLFKSYSLSSTGNQQSKKLVNQLVKIYETHIALIISFSFTQNFFLIDLIFSDMIIDHSSYLGFLYKSTIYIKSRMESLSCSHKFESQELKVGVGASFVQK